MVAVEETHDLEALGELPAVVDEGNGVAIRRTMCAPLRRVGKVHYR